jgi:hypothetical protein
MDSQSLTFDFPLNEETSSESDLIINLRIMLWIGKEQRYLEA